ncbi:MAG: hypothetical protein LBG11_03875 [Bifidobacteriaceae bacterium]|jgi:hypothetical protein|nr:hypothetical protein [Bifidobacteriaceae bacterium]
MPSGGHLSVAERFAVAPAEQVPIPPTTRRQYITGIYAMNLHSADGPSGDWHDVYHWRVGIDQPRQVRLGGERTDTNTNPIYGDWGVYDARSILESKGLEIVPRGPVWAADYYRAICDMLWHSLSRFGTVMNLDGATDDWLDTPAQKHMALDAARLMRPALPTADAKHALDRWISGEAVGRSKWLSI